MSLRLSAEALAKAEAPKGRSNLRGLTGRLLRPTGLAMTILLIFFGACAKKPPKPPKPKKPVISIPTEPAPPVPPELTPKREASQQVVQAGKEYLETGALDKAVQTFQEAINVDPENGVAYFFLAFSLFRSGLYDDALGLLDRAGTLLAPYSKWSEEVLRLKYMIEGAKEESQKEKPEEGYY